MGAEYGFKMSGSPPAQSDLVFASEYFEHHQRPIEHLAEVVSTCKPKAIVVANSFGSMSVGHFPEYRNGTHALSPRSVGRAFNSQLRELGYRTVETGLWNSRPTFWVEQ